MIYHVSIIIIIKSFMMMMMDDHHSLDHVYHLLHSLLSHSELRYAEREVPPLQRAVGRAETGKQSL